MYTLRHRIKLKWRLVCCWLVCTFILWIKVDILNLLNLRLNLNQAHLNSFPSWHLFDNSWLKVSCAASHVCAIWSSLDTIKECRYSQMCVRIWRHRTGPRQSLYSHFEIAQLKSYIWTCAPSWPCVWQHLIVSCADSLHCAAALLLQSDIDWIQF